MNTPLGRIMIFTDKTDEMVAFYGTHFGYQVVETSADDLVELHPRGPGLPLVLHPAGARKQDGQALMKLVFDVADVAGFCAAAAAKGLAFGKIYQMDGYAFANAKDPAKNPIQVSSRYARSP